MEPWITWLNQNSGAVTAFAAVAGVLVAIVYSVVTWLLWRATREQATIAREVFEASHRPHIFVMPSWRVNPNTFTLRCQLRNDGTVPAVVGALHVRVSLTQDWKPGAELIEEVKAVRRELFFAGGRNVQPAGSQTEVVESEFNESEFRLSDGQRAGGAWIEMVVDYRGAGPATYVARARLYIADPFSAPP